MPHVPNTPRLLDPLYIHALITPVHGADGGVNHNMIHGHEQGLLVVLRHYSNMRAGDWVEVFWGDETLPVKSDVVQPEQVGEDFPLFIAAARIPEGFNALWVQVTREGGGNEDSSPPQVILVRTLFPGGTDPDPQEPGHQNLLPPQPELPADGIIDEDAAKQGIKVTLPGYPNMRLHDVITFSWGGVLLSHSVTQADMDSDGVELLVSEETILEAGGSDELVLVYRVRDEVHNPSSAWSMPTRVIVEIGDGLFDAPLIENPDPAADPYEVIDLDVLGSDDLKVSVLVPQGGPFQVGDLVAPKWLGTSAQGIVSEFSPTPEPVPRVPTVMTFLIPNAEVRELGQGRGVAAYAVSRAGQPAGVSKRRFVSFIGVERRLPKPVVEHAVDGHLDPTLAATTVIVPGAVLEAGDYVYMTWLGTRANGTTLLHEDSRPVSGGGAGQPMRFAIDSHSIAPLEGGSVEVSYRLYKKSIGLELESEHERLRVSEVHAELPAPLTRPPALGGVLDPDELTGPLQLVVPPWPGMSERQTVFLLWTAENVEPWDDFMPISAPMLGKEVPFYMDQAKVEAYLGERIELSYRVETPGEADRLSLVARFSVGVREGIGVGPMLLRGGRSSFGGPYGTAAPRLLQVLYRNSLAPMLVEWRYAGDPTWTTRPDWSDQQPWRLLQVRNRDETWEFQPLNLHGNDQAFVALRDEVMGADGPVVDMVAWGNKDFGGELDDRLEALDDLVEVYATESAWAARRRDGDLVCWGNREYGGAPDTVAGPFVQVRSAKWGFVGRKADGVLHAWGGGETGETIPRDVFAHKDYIDLCGAQRAFAALRGIREVKAWGAEELGGELKWGQEYFKDVVQVVGNDFAFAALRDSNDMRLVITWGHALRGGMIPLPIALENRVRWIAAATREAFCILLDTGMIKAWPFRVEAGDVPEAIAALENVVEVSATGAAFCVRLKDGSVRAWGDAEQGGRLSDEAAGRLDIVQVTGNDKAFAALCSDGSVVAWGDPDAGGDTAAVAGELLDVRAIYANGQAFAALVGDDRVVTWGVGPAGGDSEAVQAELTGKVSHGRRVLP